MAIVYRTIAERLRDVPKDSKLAVVYKAKLCKMHKEVFESVKKAA